MFGISFAELMIIFLLVLIVMGPEKLPKVARWAGKGLRELRQTSNTLRHALTMEDFDDDSPRRKTLPADNSSASAVGTGTAPRTETKATEERPSPSPGPGGLDQVDDEAFDRMLEKEYLIHRSQIDTISLPPARRSDDLVAVPLPTVADEADERIAVDFTHPSSAPGVAS